MIKRGLIFTVTAILVLALINSCKKDDLVIKDPLDFTNPINVGLPLGSAYFEARDLLELLDSTSKDYIYVDNDSLIHFEFDSTFSTEWSDLIEFNTLTLSRSYDIDPTKKNKKMVHVFTDSVLVNVLPGQHFDSLTIAEALLSVEVETPSGFTGNYSLSFPGLTNNGEVVSFESNTWGSTFTESQNLEGALLTFVNENGNSYLLVQTTVDVEVDGTPTSTMMDIIINMNGLKPDLVFGYFGTMDVIEQTQEFEFDFFETLEFATALQFKEMSIKLGFDNYFGVPLGVIIDKMYFYKEGEDTVHVEPPSITINSATYGNPIVSSSDTIVIDQTVEGLMQGINMSPEKVFIDFKGVMNPEGDTTIHNFVSSNTLIEGAVNVDVPLWFNTSQYNRTDTFTMDITSVFKDTSQITLVDELNIYFEFDNGFPFDISIEAYALDGQNDSVANIFDEKINFLEAPIPPEISKKRNLKVSLTSDKVLELYNKNTKKIALKSFVQAGDPDNDVFIKLLSTDFIGIKLYFEVKSEE